MSGLHNGQAMPDSLDFSRYHRISQASRALCLKILTFVSLRADVNFETFADAFSLLENSYKFLPILFILYNRRIEKNFQGAKKHLPRFF